MRIPRFTSLNRTRSIKFVGPLQGDPTHPIAQSPSPATRSWLRSWRGFLVLAALTAAPTYAWRDAFKKIPLHQIAKNLTNSPASSEPPTEATDRQDLQEKLPGYLDQLAVQMSQCNDSSIRQAGLAAHQLFQRRNFKLSDEQMDQIWAVIVEFRQNVTNANQTESLGDQLTPIMSNSPLGQLLIQTVTITLDKLRANERNGDDRQTLHNLSFGVQDLMKRTDDLWLAFRDSFFLITLLGVLQGGPHVFQKSRTRT